MPDKIGACDWTLGRSSTTCYDFLYFFLREVVDRIYIYIIEMKITGTLPEAVNLKPDDWGNHQAPRVKIRRGHLQNINMPGEN